MQRLYAFLSAAMLAASTTYLVLLTSASSPVSAAYLQHGITPPPNIPAGFLRDVNDWDSIPIAGEDPAGPLDCSFGTDCATAWANIQTWSNKWNSLDLDENPNINGVTNDHDVIALACALRWRGEGDAVGSIWRTRCRNEISEAVLATYNTIDESALHPAKNLVSYVLAANTIELSSLDSTLDGQFRDWIVTVAEVVQWDLDIPTPPDVGNFEVYHENRPNNIGALCGAARIVVDMYLGGTTHGNLHLVDGKRVYRGFLGDENSYDGFVFDNVDVSWALDIMDPVPLNPEGTKVGDAGLMLTRDVGGALIDDMRRTDNPQQCISNEPDNTFDDDWQLIYTGYPWESLQGLVMQAYLLDRCGWSSFTWQTNAIERTHQWLYEVYDFPAEDANNAIVCQSGGSSSDDTWVPHIVEAIYNPGYLTPSTLVFGGKPGKNCGFADWWTIGL